MRIHRTTWQVLTPLALLAGCCSASFAGAEADKKEAPKPLPPEIVKAWTDAGAEPGWMTDVPPESTGGYQFWEPFREEAEAGTMPAFRYHQKMDVLARLPDPGVGFGLDLHCWPGKDAELKELAGLKSLQSLNIGGALNLTDAGLKELAALKNLKGLYLFYSHVSDAGVKHLAEVKTLEALDLSNTRVTGAGMKDLARLKNLQALNLACTEVSDAGLKELAALANLRYLNVERSGITATGVKKLREALPKCQIEWSERKPATPTPDAAK